MPIYKIKYNGDNHECVAPTLNEAVRQIVGTYDFKLLVTHKQDINQKLELLQVSSKKVNLFVLTNEIKVSEALKDFMRKREYDNLPVKAMSFCENAQYNCDAVRKATDKMLLFISTHGCEVVTMSHSTTRGITGDKWYTCTMILIFK